MPHMSRVLTPRSSTPMNKSPDILRLQQQLKKLLHELSNDKGSGRMEPSPSYHMESGKLYTNDPWKTAAEQLAKDYWVKHLPLPSIGHNSNIPHLLTLSANKSEFTGRSKRHEIPLPFTDSPPS